MDEGREPPDVVIGDVFQFVSERARHSACVLDVEGDGGDFWDFFRVEISNALGVDLDDIT